MHAVASSHAVLTNHGAFEGNMIFMNNSSLLIEIFGDYGNNEIHTFHRLALIFGFFYARVQPRGNTHHLAPSFVMFDDEMQEKTISQTNTSDRNYLVSVRVTCGATLIIKILNYKTCDKRTKNTVSAFAKRATTIQQLCGQQQFC